MRAEAIGKTMTVTQEDGRRRVIIEGITPAVDGGRFPAKRTVGDRVRVEADIFTDAMEATAGLQRFALQRLAATASRCRDGWIILRPGIATC